MNQIPAINLPIALPNGIAGAKEATGAESAFKEFMLESIHHVNSMQQDADHAVEQLMTGADVNPAEVLTAVQKADMTFRMMMQIRNKMVEAYQQLQDIRI